MNKKLFFRSAVVVVVAIVAIWWFYPPLHYNIRTVTRNRVYRSAELPANVLNHVVHTKKIRSIINLRNMHPGETWWEKEESIAKQNHIALYNVVLPAHTMPTKHQLQILTFIVKTAPRPILIHCRQGIDRSGLTSAIGLILQNERSLEKIQRQVSWHYLVFDSNSVGKIVLPKYFKWLKSQHKTQSSRDDYYSWLGQATL